MAACFRCQVGSGNSRPEKSSQRLVPRKQAFQVTVLELSKWQSVALSAAPQ